MEALSGAQHWARQFANFGHTIRLMTPKFDILYRFLPPETLQAHPAKPGTHPE